MGSVIFSAKIVNANVQEAAVKGPHSEELDILQFNQDRHGCIKMILSPNRLDVQVRGPESGPLDEPGGGKWKVDATQFDMRRNFRPEV